jgi:hypothetical protein
MGYPTLLTRRALNNFAILLLNDREYFFLRAPDLLPEANEAVMAIPLARERPAYLILLDRPVPIFLDPQAVGGQTGSAEWTWREEIRWQVQTMMRVCPLVLLQERRGEGLAAIAETQDRYVASRREAREKWEIKRRAEQRQGNSVEREAYFWEGRAVGWR